MSTLTKQEKQALQYLVNTGFNVDVAGFDDDHEPIGELLRVRLMPDYMVEDDQGTLRLTARGEEVLK